jgi:hypothetical protein
MLLRFRALDAKTLPVGHWRAPSRCVSLMSQAYCPQAWGAIATVTQIFPYNTIEVESVAGIRQFYPEDELEILEVT